MTSVGPTQQWWLEMMAAKKKSPVPGPVSRSVKLLQYLSEHEPTTIRNASVALSLAPSTVHRLLDLLAREGMVEHNRLERSYRIGPEFFRIAAQVYGRFDVRTLALPILREVVEACNETCVLGLYLSNVRKMSFVEKADSSRLLRYQIPLNTQISVFWGATGRSILAFLPEEEVNQIYTEESAAPGSGESLPSRRRLETDLAEIRNKGFAISRGQRIPGAVGIGAPIFGVEGSVIGSVSATMPAAELKAAKERSIGLLVREKAAELSRRLGSPHQTRFPAVETPVREPQSRVKHAPAKSSPDHA